MNEVEAAEVVRQFHILYYQSTTQTPRHMSWLGVPTVKCPLDLWIYQEILFEKRPDVIIETGTAFGGSANFLACICDLIGSGRVITVDLYPPATPGPTVRPPHPRITYLVGSSTAPEVVAEVSDSVRPEEQVMVILDSDHSKDHVLGELRAYAPLVGSGQYLIVEDTNVNGNPVFPGHGPGPHEALEEFLAETDEFVVDLDREKFMLTWNPGGYLKRVDL